MANTGHIVQRRIDIAVTDANRLKQLLAGWEGIEPTRTDHNGVRLRYDTFRWDYAVLVQMLEQAGFPVRSNWRQAMRAALFAFMDSNTRSHSKVTGGACCSRPAGIYGVEDQAGDKKAR